MYFRDHAPPHFHARYAGHVTLVSIRSLRVLKGQIPRRALALVLEWASLHREELLRNWRRAQEGVPLAPVAPLE